MSESDEQRLQQIEQEIKTAEQMISDLCRQKRRWIMSIPPRPDYDPDLVINRALQSSKNLISELRKAQRDNICDVCAGTGKPTSAAACICGGTGKASVGFINVRKLYLEAQGKLEKAQEDSVRLDWLNSNTGCEPALRWRNTNKYAWVWMGREFPNIREAIDAAWKKEPQE